MAGADLAGRAALVTGASRRAGIGFAIARRLQADGAQVFVQSWRPHDEGHPWGGEPDGMAVVLEQLRNPGHLEIDLAAPEAPARLMDAARSQLGHVDILVANHARSGRGSLDTITADELDGFWAVNVRATLLLAAAFAAQHDGRPGGRIIMLTSGQHRGPMPGELGYAVSKGAIHQATPTLADHLGERGITVNTVNPGPTDTGWADDRVEAEVRARMPRGRWGTPDDAARLIAWLCSDEGDWITGQVIDSEGGFRR
jgi:3-oxoacyl-[acyl-carrier protein] reductase